MRCGIAVVDLEAGRCVAYLEFKTGIEEIFDVQLLSNTKSALVSGPFPEDDDRPPIWIIPRDERPAP